VDDSTSIRLAETIEHLLEAANRYPLLTPLQEIELGRQIRAWQDHPGGPDQAPRLTQKRGQRALEKFLLCNLRLAHFIARRYQNRGVPMEDLMQAASEGLLSAYKRFDPAKGCRSSSYACWWAQQACQVIVAQQGNGLRLPTTVSEQLRKATRVTQILTARLNRDTLIDVTQGGEDPSAALERREISALLADLVNHSEALSPQQRHLLRCRYLQTDKPPSIARLASQLNMNRETLRRMERAALDILKALLPETTPDYLLQL